MKKSKFKSSILIINFFWILILILSTPAILYFSKYQHKKYHGEFKIDSNGRAGVNSFYQLNNLTHDVELYGWAFAESELDNSAKYVKILFVSDELAYEVDTELYDEAWTVSYYKDLKVPKAKNGYYTKFSPIGMKDGDYTLFMQVVENDIDSGIFHSYADFRKNDHEFTRLEGAMKINDLDFSLVEPSDEVKWTVDICEIRNEKLYITGWALHLDYHSLANQVYLEIVKPDETTSYFSTTRVFRESVGNQYEDSKFNMAGFWTEIPLESLGKGENRIFIIIGQKYRATTYYQYINE